MTTTHKSDRACDSPVDKLRNEFDRLLEAVWSQGEKAADAFGLRGNNKTWHPAVDVVETTETVQVRVDVPGVNPDALDIVLVGNMLTVKGHRCLEEIAAEDIALRRERPVGAFSRSIPLPVAVNADKVSAESRNGVVTITLAKEESAKSRTIHVQVKKSDGSACAPM